MDSAHWHPRKLLWHLGLWTSIQIFRYILQLVKYMVEKGEWPVLQRLTQSWWVWCSWPKATYFWLSCDSLFHGLSSCCLCVKSGKKGDIIESRGLEIFSESLVTDGCTGLSCFTGEWHLCSYIWWKHGQSCWGTSQVPFRSSKWNLG